MLRLIVVLLILANATFFAWHQGWLDQVTGVPSQPVADTQRAAQQVHPDQLIVVGPHAQAAVVASAVASGHTTTAVAANIAEPGSASPLGDAAATRCLEAGPFTRDENTQAGLQLAKVLGPSQWSTQAVALPGLWLVYMGPYPDTDLLQRKLIELRRIKNLAFEEVRSPSNLAMGISLGRFADERIANAALETMRLRGVRTARVVTARPAMELAVVKVPQADRAMQARLANVPLPAGKGFIACAS